MYFEIFGYIVAWILILLPVGLSIFTLFLMMTYPATEEEKLESAEWALYDELDLSEKNR